jgi:crotonobetainyl-CoA:carnitine CoA-transferase CaiB-like acyl-CoA transferase
LIGIRVLEIGHYTTAPLGARHLANLGAEVIKIEPMEGEAVRNWPPVRNGKSYFFTFTNSDKLSVTLDMTSPEGVEHLRQLVASADVLIENLKPGALAKRGFSIAEMKKTNPRLIYCAVSGFGADSKYAGRPAYDTVIQAMSGIMDLTRAGDVPVKTGISSVDLLGAEIAVVTILAALEHRDSCGFGQSIDLSMQDIGAWVTMPLWNDDQSAPYPVVAEANDGYVVVEAPAGQAEAVLSRIASSSLGSRSEVTATAANLGYVSSPILSVREMLESGQTRERGLVLRAVDSDGDEWPLLTSPFRLMGTPPVMGRIMGPLGSDNARLLCGPADKPTVNKPMAVR